MNNWPHLLDPVTIRGIDAAYRPQTRDEVKAFRKANILSVIRLKSGRLLAGTAGRWYCRRRDFGRSGNICRSLGEAFTKR